MSRNLEQRIYICTGCGGKEEPCVYTYIAASDSSGPEFCPHTDTPHGCNWERVYPTKEKEDD